MSIKIEGLKGLQVSLDKLAKDVIDEIGMTLVEGGEKIETRAKALTPKGGEGNLLQNSNYSDGSNPLKVVVYNPVFYAPYVEFGTKKKFNANGRSAIANEFKGKSPKGGTFTEMVASIYTWLKRKGYFPPEIRGEAAKQNYAKFVAMKIVKNGIKPQPFFYRAYDEIRPEIVRDLKNILK